MSMVETSRTVGVSNDALTRRERVVLAELAEDVTLEEIATRLFVTRNTVKSQVRSVYRKIGVSTRAEAVAWAVAHGVRCHPSRRRLERPGRPRRPLTRAGRLTA